MKRHFLLVTAMLAFGGCDDDGTSDSTAETADAYVPPAGDTFVVGLTKTGANSDLTARIVSTTPAPPERYVNSWTIEVLDATDTALTGCQVVVEPDMPAHGHGTTPVAVSEAEGIYTLDEMDLFMPGLWIVPITMTCEDTTDTATFEVWIEG